MKKLSISLVALTVMAFIGFSKKLDAFENKGGHYTLAENASCESGIMEHCHGNGTLCELTIGWDCYVEEMEEQLQ